MINFDLEVESLFHPVVPVIETLHTYGTFKTRSFNTDINTPSFDLQKQVMQIRMSNDLSSWVSEVSPESREHEERVRIASQINYCFKNNLPHLFINGETITSLPDLKCLSFLKKLHITAPELTIVPDLSHLTELTELEIFCDMSESPIFQNPGALNNLKNLQKLCLNELREPINLSCLTKLRELSLLIGSDFEYDLKLSECKQLRSLKLIGAVGAIDLSEIKRLRELKQLVIFSFQGIAFDVSNLQNIRKLALISFNGLPELDGLDKLEELSITGDISCLPCLNNLSNLKSLAISGSEEIENLEICNLQNLERLSLSSCSNQVISELGDLTNLKELTIEHSVVSDLVHLNQLTSLSLLCEEEIRDPNFSDFKQLRQLVLQNVSGEITGLESLDQLTELAIQSGDIRFLNLSKLPNLKRLELSGRFEFMPILDGLKHLDELIVDYNFNQLPDLSSSKSIQKLQIFSPMDELNIPEQITNLTLIHNKIEKVDFEKLVNLKSITLNLPISDQIFSQMANLKHLKLVILREDDQKQYFFDWASPCNIDSKILRISNTMYPIELENVSDLVGCVEKI